MGVLQNTKTLLKDFLGFHVNKLIEKTIGVEPVADGTLPEWLKKTPKEPLETPIKPKTDDPPQVIMPPPVVIFDTSLNVYNNITVNVNINLPKRILPDNITTTGGGGGSTNTQTTYSSDVKQSLANRTFGCMLCKPFYGKATDWCDAPDPEAFYNTILSNATTDLDEAIALAEQDEPDYYTLDKIAMAYISPNSWSNAFVLNGIKQFMDITKYYDVRSRAVDLLPVTGMFTNLGVNRVACELEDEELLPLDIILTTGSDCSVPITFFSDIDGYKRDQLQLIFQSVDDKRRKRSITLPSVGDINSINPSGISTLPFGGTLIEIWHDLKNVAGHVQPVQKSKFYSGYETKEECEAFVYGTYASWLASYCVDVEIKAYTIIIQDETKEEKYHKGVYKPYRAVYMGWDQEKLKWCNKKAWYL